MEQSSPELFSLHIDPTAKSNLLEAARWGRFLAIVGFVLCGLVVMMGIFFSSFINYMSRSSGGDMGGSFGVMTGAGTVLVSIMYIIIALVYFLPCLYLFRFSNKMRVALTSNNQPDLNTSFQNLKSLFKFVGILMVIVLAFYVLFIIFGIVAGTALQR